LLRITRDAGDDDRPVVEFVQRCANG